MSKQTKAPKITRRDFVKGVSTAALSGAIVAGTEPIVHATSQGDDETTPNAAPASTVSQQSNMPNILLVVTDHERFPIVDQLPAGFDPTVELPWHTFLQQNGVTFTNYHTNTALCTPSRSVIYTGQHVPKTGMFDNHSLPYISDMNCDPDKLPTIGRMLREVGYYTAYKGKWHLSDTEPCGESAETALEKYGFSDYNVDGDKGNPLEGFTKDDDIANDSIDWLQNRAPSLGSPWFLAVNFTNPHDVMYYDPDDTAYNGMIRGAGNPPPTYPNTTDVIQGNEPNTAGQNYAGVMNFDPVGVEDPSNSVEGIYRDSNGNVIYWDPPLSPTLNEDPNTQVSAHAEFNKLNEALYGSLRDGNGNPIDQLYKNRVNYYLNCLRDVDRHLGAVLQAAQSAGFGQNTIVIYTADHGDHNGAHGLVTKGPTAYRENFNCPLIIARAGLQNAGSTTDGLVCAVDLVPSLLRSLGVTDWQTRWPNLKGREEIRNLVIAPNGSASRGSRNQRGDGMLFTWDAISHSDGAFASGETGFLDLRKRSQIRCVFDGQYKFARYFSSLNYHRPTTVQEIMDNNDLELYDTWADPNESDNLALILNDPGHVRYTEIQNLVIEMNDKLNTLLENEVGPTSEDSGRFLPIPRADDLFRVGG